MSSDPRTLYMLKPRGDSIAVNRTVKVIGEGPFVVLVTDRDYEYDPGGEAQTIVFRNVYESIGDANAERDAQVNLSLADGFIQNRISVV